MIVVMKRGATKQEIDHMIRRVEELGLKSHVIYGTERTVIAAVGEKRDEHRTSLESGPGVAEVVPILAPYKVASREVKPEPTVVRVGSLLVGDRYLGMIAGPCSVENPRADARNGPGGQGGGGDRPAWRRLQAADQPLQLPGPEGRGAEDPRGRAGRNGAGRGHRGRRGRGRRVGGPLCRRAADRRRNMQNYRLLEAAGAEGKAVLLKRGAGATLDELLLAAEYVLNAGNPNVMLCERGIRTFETHTRFTLPLATVPYLHEKTHLPVLVDPSHGTGHARLVAPMAAAAVAAGADGLIVEVHPDPETALSDGYQSLTFGQFEALMELCRKVAEAVGKQLTADRPRVTADA